MDYHDALSHWKALGISDAATLRNALSDKCVDFAYNSCRIENDAVTYRDTRGIFEHDRVPGYTGDLRTLREISNAKRAYAKFMEFFARGHAFDEELVKTLQLVLTEDTYDDSRLRRGERPGEYKRHDYVVGLNEHGASAEDTPEEMAELLDDISSTEIGPGNALTAAAFFHAKFEDIHPFADGNGRAGRLAMNYLLVTHAHPFIVVHEEDRLSYYGALDAWSERRDLAPLIVFLKEQTVKTWRNAKTMTRK